MPASASTLRTDADLVLASRSGDRSAFGQIVRRYQAMISGLIYAGCGDLHRSEDIAQDTFVSAWKSLSGLRDASRLPGWLCQIARRRLADSSRKMSTSEVPFSQAFASGQEPAAAATTATAGPASAEECEFLWRTLSQIPQPYRETLVLFYRQEQSTAQVAAAMETTEEAVRQRLTRGRQMLREELATVLERNLARTAPSGRFTAQVVAALPALTAQTAGLGATAKGAAAVKGGGLATFLLGWVAPAGLVFGLIFGIVQDVRQSKTPRLRRLVMRIGIVQNAMIVVWVIGFNYLVIIRRRENWDLSTMAWAYSASTCLFSILFFLVVVWGRWQVEEVLRDEGIDEAPFPDVALWQRLVFTFPVAAIFLGWMVQLAMKAGDQVGVDIVAGAIILESLWCAWRLPQLQPAKTIQQTFETFTFALAVIVVMLNWRLAIWTGPDMPLWSFNLCALILFVWMLAMTLWDRRKHRET
jgi:RNA polymerase sigma factor (sigma-70 family)